MSPENLQTTSDLSTLLHGVISHPKTQLHMKKKLNVMLTFIFQATAVKEVHMCCGDL